MAVESSATVSCAGPITGSSAEAVRANLVDVGNLVDHALSEIQELSGEQASALLSVLEVAAGKVDALRLALVGRVERSKVWEADGPTGTPASFLKREHGVDHGRAQADLRAAQACEEHDELDLALKAGKIGRAELDLMVRYGRRTPERAAVFEQFVPMFVELAGKGSMSALRRGLQVWADQVDPLSTVAVEAEAHDRRGLYVSEVADGVKIDGFFGPEQGIRVMTAVNAAVAAHYRSRQAEDEATRGVGAAGANTERHEHDGGSLPVMSTAAQRADAFIESIIDPVLAGGMLPTCGGALPTVTVTVPINRIGRPDEPVTPAEILDAVVQATQGTPAPRRRRDVSLAPAQLVPQSAGVSTANEATQGPVSAQPMVGLLRTPNGPGEFVVSGRMAQQLSCDATIQRVMVDPVGKPLDVGRRTRLIPEQIRSALIVRDGRCRFPFCTKPAGWCHAHHVVHWSQGGPTSLDNLILLCSAHHHQIHSDNIPIEFADGIPQVRLDRARARGPTAHPLRL